MTEEEVVAVSRVIGAYSEYISTEVAILDKGFQLNEAELSPVACAAIAALDKLRGWRPIETAPKKRDVLLMDDSGDCAVSYWNSVEECWCAVNFDSCLPHDAFPNPTHWMPLPKAPGKEKNPLPHDPLARHAAPERPMPKC